MARRGGFGKTDLLTDETPRRRPFFKRFQTAIPEGRAFDETGSEEGDMPRPFEPRRLTA